MEFTQEVLTAIWEAQVEEPNGGIDMVDVPGHRGFTAVRRSNGDLEQTLVIDKPVTFNSSSDESLQMKYVRSRPTVQAAWWRWERA